MLTQLPPLADPHLHTTTEAHLQSHTHTFNCGSDSLRRTRQEFHLVPVHRSEVRQTLDIGWGTAGPLGQRHGPIGFVHNVALPIRHHGNASPTAAHVLTDSQHGGCLSGRRPQRDDEAAHTLHDEAAPTLHGLSEMTKLPRRSTAAASARCQAAPTLHSLSEN
jgi:hypothetical protein